MKDDAERGTNHGLVDDGQNDSVDNGSWFTMLITVVNHGS